MTRRTAAVLPYAVFAFLAAVSWQRWIEPFVDTGRELMVPWRVSQGEALYRDVRFYYGPLGPYLAAGIDLVFGRSLSARAVLAGLIALLHLEALRRLAGRLLPAGLAALTASLAVAVCFFLRPGGVHIFPYSLDTSIAVAAVTGALLLASGARGTGRDRAAAACLFAALVARPEIGLAGLAALTVERLLARDRAATARIARLGAVALATAAAIYGALSAGTPLPILKREGWLTFLFLPPEFRSVYTSFAGVDRPGLRLAELALALIVLLFAGLWLLVAAIVAARSKRSSGTVAAGAVAVLAAAGAVAVLRPAALAPTLALLPPIVRAVPPLLFAAAGVGLLRRMQDRSRPSVLLGIPDGVLFVALYFAARLFLAAGYVGPYSGFYLPLPLVVVSAVLLSAAARLPDRLAIAPPPRLFPRLVSAALAVFLLARVATLARSFRHPAWSRVTTPAGSLYLTEPIADATRRALDDLSRRVPAGGAIAGFPEPGLFNWTLGRANPLAQDQFFPGHLDAAAESEVIERMKARPPEAVVTMNVLTIGHGPARFGRDYLRRLDEYCRAAFPAVAAYGPGAEGMPRVGDPGFFIEIRARQRSAP